MKADVVLLRVDRAAARHTRHPRHLHPALDLKYIQAALEARLAGPVPLVDGWLAPFTASECVAQVLAMQPRIVVIRAVTWCLDESLAVARLLKAAGVFTIAVGQQVLHQRAVPVAGWLESFDLALAGEPELAVPELIVRRLGGTTKEFLQSATRGTASVDHPDILPVPRFSAEELAAYPFPFPVRGQSRPLRNWGYLLTAWGCPRPCRHCSSIVRKSVGRPLRGRSIDQVLDEVARLAEQGAEAIAFEDDSLFVHRRRLLDLCEGLQRRGLRLPWLANARPDELDEETVAAAAAAGAAMIKVGVETGAAGLIEAIGKSDNGASWRECSRQAFRRLDAAGIGSVGLFLVGLPGETDADRAATVQLAIGLPIDYLQVQIWQPYPDVALGAEGAAGPHYHYAESGTGGDPARWQRHLYRKFYARGSYLSRYLSLHWRPLVQTPRANLRRLQGLAGALVG